MSSFILLVSLLLYCIQHFLLIPHFILYFRSVSIKFEVFPVLRAPRYFHYFIQSFPLLVHASMSIIVQCIFLLVRSLFFCYDIINRIFYILDKGLYLQVKHFYYVPIQCFEIKPCFFFLIFTIISDFFVAYKKFVGFSL